MDQFRAEHYVYGGNVEELNDEPEYQDGPSEQRTLEPSGEPFFGGLAAAVVERNVLDTAVLEDPIHSRRYEVRMGMGNDSRN